MAQCDDRPAAVARRRGRPVNSDSAETRNRILRASRQVINERGYQAATFQAIAVAAELSRPTLHYYFSSREEIYLTLLAEARVLVADFIARAQQHETLVAQFSALVHAIQATDPTDRSQVAFLVSARLESVRNPELRPYAGTALQDFLTALVGAAKARGELREDTAIAPVVDMLYAMLLGVGFYAGFVDPATDMKLITSQLDHMVTHGLLAAARMAPDGCGAGGDAPSVVGGRQ
jgi:AcrR family transcriptional regulator